MGVSLPLFRPTQSQNAPPDRPKRVSILGATGSIGDSTLQVLEQHPNRFDVVALVGGNNAKRMAQLVSRLQPKTVAMADGQAAKELSDMIDQPVLSGDDGVLEASAQPADLSVCAITGFAGLKPTLAAIGAGNDIALANKESMVCAGPFVIEAARNARVNILPVDSEHSALFQCLMGQDLSSVKTVVLTASGGPFRAFSPAELGRVTVDQALAHPNWSMGSKVTIDSSTLMNKGLEVIEARWLFDAAPQDLQAVIHPQSIVHSLIHYQDGSMLAQMGVPTMVTPISLAMGWPGRLDMTDHDCGGQVLNPAEALTRWSGLIFEEIDRERFPCYSLSLQALADGLPATIVLNAANEVAVDRFLNGQIGYADISKAVGVRLDALKKLNRPAVDHIDDVFALDAWARGD